MGLDIVAYAPATFVEGIPPRDDLPLGLIAPVNALEFTRYAPTLKIARTEKGLIRYGVYSVGAPMFSFRAGSYSFYGGYRDWLSQLTLGASARDVWADPARYASRPMTPLICFTAVDGTIDAPIARRLHAAHVEARERVVLGHVPGRFVELLALFTKAFKIASGDGLVVFC